MGNRVFNRAIPMALRRIPNAPYIYASDIWETEQRTYHKLISRTHTPPCFRSTHGGSIK